ncbi:MAG TPA: MFS transporter [Polyangia bacterium]|nr:MFS transporter [Polyangia bacterium]
MRSGVPIAMYYFVLFAAFGTFWPYFTLYLQSAGLPPSAITRVFAIFPVMNVLAPPLFGLLADAWRARGLLQRLLSGAAGLAFAGFFIAGSSRLALVIVTALFGLVRAPLGTMADASTLELVRKSGGSYGRLRLWGSIGFIVAVLGGGELLERRGINAVMAASLGGLSVLAVVAWLIPSPAPRAEPRAVRAWRALLRRGDLWLFLGAVTLTVMAASAYDSAFTLHLARLGYRGRFTGVAWATGVVCEVLLMAASARIIAKLGVERLFALTLLTAALRWLALSEVTARPAILLLQPLHGVTFGLFYVSGVTIMRGRASAEAATAAQGLFAAAFALGGVIGYPIAGRLFERDPAFMFRVAACVAAVALACALTYLRVRPRTAGPLPADAAIT